MHLRMKDAREDVFIIILQDAIFPLHWTDTFLHDAHERFFDPFCTPISLADILFCVSDSISGVACAKLCVKGGISLSRNCSDFGVFR